MKREKKHAFFICLSFIMFVGLYKACELEKPAGAYLSLYTGESYCLGNPFRKQRKLLEMMLISACVTVFWWKSSSSNDYVYWEQAHFTPSPGQHRSWQRQGPWHMRSSELLTWEEEENINGWIGLWWCMELKQNEHCRVTPPPLLFSLQCQTQPGMPIQPWPLIWSYIMSKTSRNMLFSPTVWFSGLTPCPHFCLRKMADMSPLVPPVIATVCTKDDW